MQIHNFDKPGKIDLELARTQGRKKIKPKGKTMKKNQIVCAVVFAAFLGHILTIQFMQIKSDYSIFIINGAAGHYFKENPPPGWTITTDGKKFRWVRPSGLQGTFDNYTKQRAIASAWDQFEYEVEEANGEKWEQLP